MAYRRRPRRPAHVPALGGGAPATGEAATACGATEAGCRLKYHRRMSSSPEPPVYTGTSAAPAEVAVDLLFIPVFGKDDSLADLGDVDGAVGREWSRALASGEFAHRLYDVFVARVESDVWRARRLAFLGAGLQGEADAERLRRLAAACGAAARQRGAASMAFLLRGGLPVEAATAVADGLATTEFDAGIYKRERENTAQPLVEAAIVAPGATTPLLESAVARGVTIGRAANFARAVANEPGNVLTPRVFAARVSGEAAAAGLNVEVLDEPRLTDLGMRLLLSVAQGSPEPPQLVVIRHEPANAPATPVLAFVGKGVTFDTGGISIKPAAGMEQMKSDMSGGAAVAAALIALARLGAPFRILGIVPTVENMPDGRATRPGDVVTGASGTSVEIVNTDAEGRLILADALWYAEQLGATHVVDVATLTGACVVALGRSVSAVLGQPAGWVESVREAGSRAGERVWPLPIYEEAREQLNSDVADLRNSGGRPGGTITAAAFLREFTRVPNWAHIDIAGTAWADAGKPYQPKGPTGSAVRTLIELGMTAGKSPAVSKA